MSDVYTICIVGGGAGGLELVARLARSKLFRQKKIRLVLIDNKLKHIWKPLFHEVATGAAPHPGDEIDYLFYASQLGFTFYYGSLKSINRAKKEITLSAVEDSSGDFILPERTVSYDFLVLAIGSLTNDFQIPGVRQHCIFLDNLYQAESFNRYFLFEIIKFIQNEKSRREKYNIAIIGGGATGVELAAEIQSFLSELYKYSLTSFSPENHFQIKLIETAARILSGLPEKVSHLVKNHLEKTGIEILTHEQVVKVTPLGIETKSGLFIPAAMKIWCAGVIADPVLTNLDGLETNKINQLTVNQNLTTTMDESIFAMGDCASCPQPQSDNTITYVPPRAQAAHQQARLLTKSLEGYLLQNKKLLNYYYSDYGTLVTMGRKQVVGTVMRTAAHSLYIKGLAARFSYWLLYKTHQITLSGFRKTFAITLANLLMRKTRPRLKLH